MQTVLPASKRGHANFGWLDSHHSFSFGQYYNPERMGFRCLRVINEDRIVGGSGFPSHPHQDMEIITYVIEGALIHKDTMGNSTQINPCELQRMSAGTGIRHSEFNASQEQKAHFLQIWIEPEKRGVSPSYEQKSFLCDFQTKSLVLVASPDGEDGSLTLNQNAYIHLGKFKSGEERRIGLEPGRHAWVQVIEGSVQVNGAILSASDGMAISDEIEVLIDSKTESEFLVFDLP